MRPFSCVLCCVMVVAAVGSPSLAEDLYMSSRKVFITSVTGTGNLGAWVDAGGATGLAAGDAICQARAAAAGLDDPSHFVAWLSDASTDAYCHVQNLSGTKAANCGEASLPAAAGPWVRVDGYPFAGTLDEAMRPIGRILTPVWFNEYGAYKYDYPFTNTDAYGVRSARSATPCSNWTSSASAVVEAGNPTNGGDGWTYGHTANCQDPHPLLCMQTLAGPPLPPYHSGGALAFVSSVKGVGRMQSWPESDGYSGLAGGDHVCRNLASAAGLPQPNHYYAWMSSSTTDAKDRRGYDGPWVRVDGVKVADSKADIIDGVIDAQISVDEYGTYVTVGLAWTGTMSSGLADTNHCLSWTADAAPYMGESGNPADAFWGWTSAATETCSTQRRIYCFGDLATVIFIDDYESAGTSGWSSTVFGP